MYDYRVYIEITEIRGGSCEVLITGEDKHGIQSLIDAQQVPWPIQARSWRPMTDAARRWLAECSKDE